jgi:phage terminase large subunit-like protein
LFIKKQDIDTKQTLKNPDDYAYFKINPLDNARNLSGGYLDTLQALGARLRKRFLDGDFSDATAHGLFDETAMDKWRLTNADDAPEMVRIVVSVDPSGSGDTDNADNDAIGIVVAGLGQDGNGYLMADLTVKAGPATWGKVATDAYERFLANTVVGEVNFGGAMVEHVIQTARPRTPYRSVVATRNKAVRAEPVAALADQGKIRHIGFYADLEEELAGMTTNGYVGENSPNRADAYVWAFTELFGEIVQQNGRKKESKPRAPINWRVA